MEDAPPPPRPTPPAPPPSGAPRAIRAPRYGCFLRWPEEGDSWVHPADAPRARRLLPSPRVWRREPGDGGYDRLVYGDASLRVLPALWLELPPPAFELGAWVEVRSLMLQNDPVTGRVREALWDEGLREVVFQIESHEKLLERRFLGSDLKAVTPPKAVEDLRIEPPATSSLEDLDDLLEGLERDDAFGRPPG